MNAGQSREDVKPLHWIGSARKDLKTFPEAAMHDIGIALYRVQLGGRPLDAKPLKGFAGADILEIVDRYDTDTYRVIYTIRFSKAVYVLHAFMKKSKRGIKTPQGELDVIKARLRCAEKDYRERYPNEKD